MIEEIVIRFLSGNLDIPVYGEYPQEEAGSFVIAYKGGGSRTDLLDSAMILVESYAGTKYAAALLNEKVKEAMDSLTELECVSASRLQNDYPFPDKERKRHRYQAVYNITYY